MLTTMSPTPLFQEQTLKKLPLGSGVLPYQSIRGLIDRGQLRAETDIEESQLQPASIDLRLGSVGYEVRASFLPGPQATVRDMVNSLVVDEIDLDRGAILRRGSVYILELQESTVRTQFLGRANPKSTTGRLDLFTRLITNGADSFDTVEKGYSGPLYVEVAPKTFNVRVRTGSKLNQLRFFKGISAQLDMSREAVRHSHHDAEALIYGGDGEPRREKALNGVWFSVDLQARDEGILGWKAVSHAPVIDLEKIDYYDPADFWEAVPPRADSRLILMPGEFYILGSKERVSVPPAFAAEMIPYDPSMGEFRVHYAGFFDPGFGYGSAGELHGTRAILEVRSYEVPYLMKDGQRIGRLSYQRLLEEPEKLYGSEGTGSSYQDQGLGLSKQFQRPRH